MIKFCTYFIVLMSISMISFGQINDFQSNSKLGIIFGTNFNFLRIEQNNNYSGDSVLSVKNVPKIGISLGISYKVLNKRRISLSFLPVLNAITSELVYKNINTSENIKFNTDFFSFSNDFELKIKSLRYKNLKTNLIASFSPIYYIKTSGTFYTNIEKNIISEYQMKFKKIDLSYSYGIGFDYFTTTNYHSVEIIFSNGINNLLISDKSEYSKILNSIFLDKITIRYIFNK